MTKRWKKVLILFLCVGVVAFVAGVAIEVFSPPVVVAEAAAINPPPLSLDEAVLRTEAFLSSSEDCERYLRNIFWSSLLTKEVSQLSEGQLVLEKASPQELWVTKSSDIPEGKENIPQFLKNKKNTCPKMIPGTECFILSEAESGEMRGLLMIARKLPMVSYIPISRTIDPPLPTALADLPGD